MYQSCSKQEANQVLRYLGVWFESQTRRPRFAIGGIVFPLSSACRHAARTISSSLDHQRKLPSGYMITRCLAFSLWGAHQWQSHSIWDLRFQMSCDRWNGFLLIVCTEQIFTALDFRFEISNRKFTKRVLSDTQMFQHIARCKMYCHQYKGQKNSTLGPS